MEEIEVWQFSAFTVLATLVLVLMVGVSGGILYLTAAEWRDRRRQEQESRERIPIKRRK
ncbi:MAG: hypothetical protein Fur0025_25210 [Oscillatoriaceae cyanobacterium]